MNDRTSDQMSPPLRRSSKLPAVVTVSLILVASALFAFIIRSRVEFFSVSSKSMQPALEPGDQIVVSRQNPPPAAGPVRGEVVVFRLPADPETYYVKRVIAIPGDLLEIEPASVRVGGVLLREPWLAKEFSNGPSRAEVISPDHYFVMGDNREDSLDSRVWGTVHRSSIIGRARAVVWSSSGGVEAHAATHAFGKQKRDRSLRVRWDRILRKVR